MSFQSNESIVFEISSRTLTLLQSIVSEIYACNLDELPRVIFHAVMLCNIIGGFWLLDSLKDPIVANTIGMELQPMAKLVSVIFTLFVVCIYDYMTSVFNKTSLFHILSVFYGTLILIIAALLSHPVYGLNNNHISSSRTLGWVSYCVIESFGSLTVTLFWSFTNSVMNLEQAKGVYGFIIATAQMGAIIGATVATEASSIGVSQLCLIGSISVYTVSLLTKTYEICFPNKISDSFWKVDSAVLETGPHSARPEQDSNILSATSSSSSNISCQERKVPQEWKPGLGDSSNRDDQDPSSSKNNIDTNNDICQTLKRVLYSFSRFYEGLTLIVKYSYVSRLLAVSCLYEIVITILDFKFKVQGNESVTAVALLEGIRIENDVLSIRFTGLMGKFGQTVNLVSLCVSIFGFSFIVRRIGVRSTLLIFPMLLFIAVVLTNLVPSLWLTFVIVSILKGLTYSLCDPVKELLYMPTSDAIKFRAKAWIDVFGSRLAKAVGSLFTLVSGGDLGRLRMISEIPCIIICVVYLILAWQIGGEFEVLTSNKIVIGQHADGDSGADTLPIVNGLWPGDVGYQGYDLRLFEGVEFPDFVEDSDTDADTDVRVNANNRR